MKDNSVVKNDNKNIFSFFKAYPSLALAQLASLISVTSLLEEREHPSLQTHV